MGNEIICINNNDFPFDLTLNKKYDVINIYSEYQTYLIRNDIGRLVWYNKNRFINITEDRKNKINKIKERLCGKKVI